MEPGQKIAAHIDESSLDQSASLISLIKPFALPKQIAANLKEKKALHPSAIQSTLMQLVGTKKHLAIEAPSASGKTTGALLFALCHLSKHPETKSIGIIVPNHKFIASVYTRLLEIVARSPIRLVNLDSDKQTEREAGGENITVYIGSYLSFFKCFQEEKVPLQDFGMFIFDDVEYAVSLGNNHKLLQLCRFLAAKLPEENKSFILVSGNSELETFKEIKEAFGVKFTNLRLVSDANDKPEGEEDEDGRTELMKTLIKQYYYIGTDLQLVSAMYLLAKYDVFRGPILVVADTLDQAYRLKVFFDRANTGEAQVYNTEGVLNIRAYNLALFNGGNLRFLMVPKDFCKDLRKNKSTVQSLKSLRNLIFFNVELNIELYNSFLNLFKSVQSLGGGKNADMGNKVLALAAHKIDEELKPKESLLTLMSKQKDKYGQVLFEPLPIPVGDIDAFSNRVENVLSGITTKKVKIFRLIELKRQLLRNKNMKVSCGITLGILCQSRTREDRPNPVSAGSHQAV